MIKTQSILAAFLFLPLLNLIKNNDIFKQIMLALFKLICYLEIK